MIPAIARPQLMDWEIALKTVDGARNGARTRDLNLGKVALYQLSYSRVGGSLI